MKSGALPRAAAAPRSSEIPAGAVRPQAPLAGPVVSPRGRRRSTRPLYRIAEPGDRLVRSDRFILHVLGDHIDHRGGHAVLLRHVVREAEHRLVGGDGLFERGRRAALAIRPAGTREVHIGAHGYRPGDLRVHGLDRRIHDELGHQRLAGLQVGLLALPEDEGIGISDEDKQHLFERFFRAKNAVNIQGTGLGLHIVAKYVELMQGRIALDSKLNSGTIFTIHIPQKTYKPVNEKNFSNRR